MTPSCALMKSSCTALAVFLHRDTFYPYTPNNVFITIFCGMPFHASMYPVINESRLSSCSCFDAFLCVSSVHIAFWHVFTACVEPVGFYSATVFVFSCTLCVYMFCFFFQLTCQEFYAVPTEQNTAMQRQLLYAETSELKVNSCVLKTHLQSAVHEIWYPSLPSSCLSSLQMEVLYMVMRIHFFLMLY